MATVFTIGFTKKSLREFVETLRTACVVRALGRLRARRALAKMEHLAQSDSSESVKLSAEAATFLIKEENNQ